MESSPKLRMIDRIGVMPMPPAIMTNALASSSSGKALSGKPTGIRSPSLASSHRLFEPPCPCSSRFTVIM
ncbi:hypothetical protein D3C81_2236820 [compost metagenome]